MIVQRMVCSALDQDSYAGVLYSRHPRLGTGVHLQYARAIYGEDLMTGRLVPEERLKEESPLTYGYLDAHREALAARMVGRERDGTPLAPRAARDIPGLSRHGAWRAQIEAMRVRSDMRAQGLGQEKLSTKPPACVKICTRSLSWSATKIRPLPSTATARVIPSSRLLRTIPMDCLM